MLAVVIVPLAAVWLGIAFQHAEGARWVRAQYDPDYCYLLNAVNLAEGVTPVYTDHPGTPVMEIAAAVLSARHWLSGHTGKLRDQVLDDPERAIDLVTIVLRGMHSIALVALGVWARRLTGSCLCAVAAQAITLSSFLVLSTMHRLNPEIMLLTLSLLLSMASLRAILRPGPVWHRYAVVSGALFGLGVACKVTFLPMALLPLGLLLERGARGWGQRIIFAFMALAAFAAGVSPVLSRWDRASQWLWHLFLGDGRYGASTGHLIVNPQTYFHNLVDMIEAEPVTFGVAVLGFIIAVCGVLSSSRVGGSLDERRKRTLRMLMSTVAAMFAQFILVAKHPGPRYLMPAVGVSGLCACLSASVLFDGVRPRLRLLGPLAAACVAGALLWLDWSLASRLRLARADTAFRSDVWKQAQAHLNAGDLMVPCYGASSPAYALWFGDQWTGYKFAADIDKRIAGNIEYAVWHKEFRRAGKRVADELIRDMAAQGKLFIQSDSPNYCPPGFVWEPVTKSPSAEVVYQLHVQPEASTTAPARP